MYTRGEPQSCGGEGGGQERATGRDQRDIASRKYASDAGKAIGMYLGEARARALTKAYPRKHRRGRSRGNTSAR